MNSDVKTDGSAVQLLLKKIIDKCDSVLAAINELWEAWE